MPIRTTRSEGAGDQSRRHLQPVFLGKNLAASEMTMVALYIMVSSVTVLFLTSIAVVAPAGIASLSTNQGPHGFSEIFYAYASAFANNGQNFAGLSANSLP